MPAGEDARRHSPNPSQARFAPLPTSAAWRHQGARTGFEVAQFEPRAPQGYRVFGCTTAVEADQCWTVQYEIDIDADWTTRRAVIVGRSADGPRRTVLESEGDGHWRVDGHRAEHLDGCLDVDLESSALTNTLPVHRLELGLGESASAPAAYVRATGLTVERLEQTYLRRPDEAGGHTYDYSAPVFDFACRLTYDPSGLVLDYPGIAVRVA